MTISIQRRAVIVGLAIITAGLVETATSASSIPKPVTAPAPAQTYRVGSTDDMVRNVQSKLRSFGYTIVVDGIFGPQTDRIVRAWQRANNLVVDGIVGPQTLRSLGLSASGTPATPTPAPQPASTTPPAAGRYRHPYPNVERWHDLAIQVGWTEAEWKTLSCVIYHESRGNERSTTGQFRGLMQIGSSVHSARIARMGGNADKLYDPGFNMKVGLQMYREGQKWRPWTVAPRCT